MKNPLTQTFQIEVQKHSKAYRKLAGNRQSYRLYIPRFMLKGFPNMNGDLVGISIGCTNQNHAVIIIDLMDRLKPEQKLRQQNGEEQEV